LELAAILGAQSERYPGLGDPAVAPSCSAAFDRGSRGVHSPHWFEPFPPGDRHWPCGRQRLPADLHDLSRFIQAQEDDFELALSEIQAGQVVNYRLTLVRAASHTGRTWEPDSWRVDGLLLWSGERDGPRPW